MARGSRKSSNSSIDDAVLRTDAAPTPSNAERGARSAETAGINQPEAPGRQEENYAATARQILSGCLRTATGKRGRKSSINDQVINAVATNVAIGMPEEFACLEA